MPPPQPGKRQGERHQYSGKPRQTRLVENQDVYGCRARRERRNLKRGPKAAFRDEQPDRATDFENAGEIAKPLTDSDLGELLHHGARTDQFDAAGNGKSNCQKNSQNPGEDIRERFHTYLCSKLLTI